MLFLGNPGTGKTTVARLVARMLHSLGQLKKGQLIEVTRKARATPTSHRTAYEPPPRTATRATHTACGLVTSTGRHATL